MAASSHIDPDALERALAAPERAHFAPRTPPPHAARVVIAPTSSGPIVGVNFDAPAPGLWPRAPQAVALHNALIVAAPGLWMRPLVALNAAGLLAVALPRTARHPVRRPLIDLDPIAHSAYTLEGAVREAQKRADNAPHAYLFVEAETGRAALYERAAGRERVTPLLPERPTLLPERAADAEMRALAAPARSYQARRRGELAQQIARAIPATPAALASALAIGLDERLLFGPCASIHTCVSVIAEPAERRLWIAAGPTPAPLSGWHAALIDDRGARCDPHAAPLYAEGTPTRWHETPAGRAANSLRDALDRAVTDPRALGADAEVEHALALWPCDPDLHALAGLIAARAGAHRRAESALERAQEIETDPARRAELAAYLAINASARGWSAEARARLQEIARDPDADPALALRARRAARRAPRSIGPIDPWRARVLF